MSTAVILMIAQNWKQPKCPSADVWTHPGDAHTFHTSQEHKGAELLIHTAWMSLRCTALMKETRLSTWHRVRFHSYDPEKSQKKLDPERQNTAHHLPSGGGRGTAFTAQLFWVMEVFCILVVVIITWLHTFVKTHHAIYLKGKCDSV